MKAAEKTNVSRVTFCKTRNGFVETSEEGKYKNVI